MSPNVHPTCTCAAESVTIMPVLSPPQVPSATKPSDGESVEEPQEDARSSATTARHGCAERVRNREEEENLGMLGADALPSWSACESTSSRRTCGRLSSRSSGHLSSHSS